MVVARRLCVLVAVAALLIAVAADSAMAQPGGGRGGRGGGRGGGFGGGFGGNSALDLLQNQSVQQELELLDDQIKQVEDLAQNNNSRDRIREAFAQLRDLPDDQRREKFGEIMASIREETEKQLDTILLPHQSERLKQIQNQLAARRGGSGISGQLAEELGITEQQQEEMRTVAEKAFAEMREKQEQLRQQAQDQILSVLTKAQRKKYDDLMGEPFDYQPDRRTFGGGGGGGGRRGGAAGGGRRGGGAGGGRRGGGANN
jgi:Spy/CpxP family protein refolding chaperone